MANNGSLGVTDPIYEQYALMYPDLMDDYQQNWAHKGVTLPEYGAMHYHEYGQSQGRAFPSQNGSPPPQPYGGGSSPAPSSPARSTSAKKSGGNNGSLGVTDPVYEQYAMMHPDLMADYQKNWAPRGVTLSEYGAMHYHEYGQQEGRGFPGQGGSSGGGGYGGGGGGGYGGGGGGNAAQDAQNKMLEEMKRQEEAAKKAEQERKAQQKKDDHKINWTFDKRAEGYDKYGNDLYAHNKSMFDESADQARSQTNFAMARTGHMGGSVDADTNAELERLYQNGLTNLRSGATDAANSLKARDNQQRNQLLQMSGSGQYRSALDPGTSVANDTSMTTMNAGVGNQFASLLGGIGGASRNKNPWGGYY